MVIFINNRKRIRRISLLISIFTISVLTLASIWGARQLPKLQTQYSMLQFLPKKHPLLERENKVRERYQLGALPPILALIDLGKSERGAWLEPERAGRLRAATKHFASLKGAVGATSIATVDGAIQTKEGVNVAGILASTPAKSWKRRVLSDPLLVPQLISKDGRAVLVVIDREELSNDAISRIGALVRTDLQKRFPASRVHLGGVPVMQAEMSGLLSHAL